MLRCILHFLGKHEFDDRQVFFILITRYFLFSFPLHILAPSCFQSVIIGVANDSLLCFRKYSSKARVLFPPPIDGLYFNVYEN